MRQTLALLFLAGLFAFSSCQKDVAPKPQALTADGSCNAKSYELRWNDYDGLAGNVVISNDDTYLYVKITLDPYRFNIDAVGKNVFLWVGDDITKAPVLSGTCFLDPSKFQYSDLVTDPSAVSYTFKVSFADISALLGKTVNCNSRLFLIPRADINAFSGTIDTYAKDNIATCDLFWSYVNYQGVCCTPPPPPPPPTAFSGTVFAKGSYVFATDPKANPESLSSLMLTKDRWGWAINIPTGNNTYTYDVWGGAGLNNTSKGVKVGKVTITVTGSTYTVKYEMTAGYTMSELHIYAGDTKPTTIAPGQYGYTKTFSPGASSHEKTFTLTDSNGDGLWFICHAVASSL